MENQQEYSPEEDVLEEYDKWREDQEEKECACQYYLANQFIFKGALIHNKNCPMA